MPAEDALDGYVDALVAGDRRRAFTVVETALRDGLTLRELYLSVFQPALREIGRRWEVGALTVAQEHLATAITPTVPAPDVVRMARELRPDVVAVSASLPPSLMAVRPLTTELRGLGPPAPLILLGGRPFLGRPGLAAKMGGDLTADNAGDAVDQLKRRVG